jgi:hypothetical protein
MNNNPDKSYFAGLFDISSIKLIPEILNSKQKLLLWSLIVLSIIVRIFFIPYSMHDIGDPAERVWNALWWSQHPSFVIPQSAHPLWFYVMGPVFMITKEFYYTSAYVMILLMTVGAFYIFKITLILSDFKTALIAFSISILNPVIFRLNFQPSSQQIYINLACVMIYFFIKALGSPESKKFFVISGVFAFLGLSARPEALFVMLALSVLAIIVKKKGAYNFIFLALLFQVIWIIISLYMYGTPFMTLQGADTYTDPANIHGLSLALRIKGFFLPYFFLVLGLTVIVFWYFLKGTLYSYRKYTKIITMVLLVPIFVPAVINGIAGAKSPVYNTTNFIYPMFFFGSIFAAIGLSRASEKLKPAALRVSFISVVILSSIPLSYVKEFVPEKYNKLFPKVIEFLATSEDPKDAWKMINFIDNNINRYPALVFDSQNSASSVFYIPYRTKLPGIPADDPKLFIYGYNEPTEKNELKRSLLDFLTNNKTGIIMVKRTGTVMSEAINDIISDKSMAGFHFAKIDEAGKWDIYTYQ